jgi:hypothetical protein
MPLFNAQISPRRALVDAVALLETRHIRFRCIRRQGSGGVGSVSGFFAFGRTYFVDISDAGSRYTAIHYGKTLMLAGLIPSVGTVGDALDNALCEKTIRLPSASQKAIVEAL